MSIGFTVTHRRLALLIFVSSVARAANEGALYTRCFRIIKSAFFPRKNNAFAAGEEGGAVYNNALKRSPASDRRRN